MSHPAMFCIRDGGRDRFWAGRSAANTLDEDLFWGPDWCRRHLERLRPADTWWPVGYEGGAVVDYDGRGLLWWGGEASTYDPSHRAVVLDLLPQVWPGWTVRWADGGEPQLAAACGVTLPPGVGGLPPDADADDLNADDPDDLADGAERSQEETVARLAAALRRSIDRPDAHRSVVPADIRRAMVGWLFGAPTEEDQPRPRPAAARSTAGA